MRIAQFAESYRPVINGASVAVDLLAEELRRRHHVSIFAPAYPGHEDGPDVHRFRSYRTPFQPDYPLAIPFSRRLRRRFRSAGFQVVHTHSPFALGRTGLRWARAHGIPAVTTYHTLYVEYAHYAPVVPRPLTERWLVAVSRDYCNACDAVVVPTNPVRDVLREYGVRRPIYVIPTGLKLREPIPRNPDFPRGRWGIPEDAVLVVYAGRLAKEKNLPLLLRSFARAAASRPQAWLLMAGNGPCMGDCRELARSLPVSKRIVLTGFVAPERMGELYAGGDLFLFTSVTDTQGLVLTEAKAAGLPVVSVNAYGPGVVVRDGEDGLLVEPVEQELAAALGALLDDRERRSRMSRAALQNARGYSIESTAAAYEAVYRLLLGE